MTLVIIMRFRIADDRQDEWESLVGKRSKEPSDDGDLQRMYLLRPQGTDTEYRVVSWWSKIERPDAWIRKEAYAYSESDEHPGIVVGPVEHEVLEIVSEY